MKKEIKTQSKLEQFASPIVAENNFIKASFGGFAGSGKTRTATELIIGAYKKFKCKKPVLIIDNEKGSRFLIPIFAKAGIKCFVKDTVKLADVLEAMELLRDREIDFLFVDTLSKVWYDYVADYKKANGNIKFMTLQDWGKILPSWQEAFSDKFVNASGNIIFTGRGGFQYEKEEDTKNEAGQVTKKGQFVKSGVKMKLAGETPFEPDINVWMELQQDIDSQGNIKVYREAQIMKDRSGLIDGKTFVNPTFEDFAPVVEFLLNVKVGEVKGASNNENLAPSENYEWYREKEAREHKLDEIKTLFDKYGFSANGKEDKQLKAVIIEKVFGTTSSEVIGKLNSKELTIGHNRLRIILSEMEEAPGTKLDYAKNIDLDVVDAEIGKLDNPMA
jgi:hypothetical protein